MGYSWMPSGKTRGTLSEHEKGLSTYAESPTGGLDGDRTHDLLFRRQTLYPLSYKPEQLLYCTPTITRAKPLSSNSAAQPAS